MEVFMNILLVFVAISLIVLVLIQPDRSKGMSGSIGTGGMNSIFGVHQDGGPLAKLTKIMAFMYIILSMVVYLIR